MGFGKKCGGELYVKVLDSSPRGITKITFHIDYVRFNLIVVYTLQI